MDKLKDDEGLLYRALEREVSGGFCKGYAMVSEGEWELVRDLLRALHLINSYHVEKFLVDLKSVRDNPQDSKMFPAIWPYDLSRPQVDGEGNIINHDYNLKKLWEEAKPKESQFGDKPIILSTPEEILKVQEEMPWHRPVDPDKYIMGCDPASGRDVGVISEVQDGKILKVTVLCSECKGRNGAHDVSCSRNPIKDRGKEARLVNRVIKDEKGHMRPSHTKWDEPAGKEDS